MEVEQVGDVWDGGNDPWSLLVFTILIGPDDLVEYLGPAPYKKDRMYTSQAPPGIAIGLGYRGDGSGSVRSPHSLQRQSADAVSHRSCPSRAPCVAPSKRMVTAELKA